MASTLDLLKLLNEHRVLYVLVGGLAGVIHGSQLVTEDVDICAPLDNENLARVLAALRDINPKFRMHPDRPPLPQDRAKLAGFKNLYLDTDLGQIDILSEIVAVGAYDEVACHTITVVLDGMECRVLNLDTLIATKKALGRPRDLQAVKELEAIRERIRIHE